VTNARANSRQRDHYLGRDVRHLSRYVHVRKSNDINTHYVCMCTHTYLHIPTQHYLPTTDAYMHARNSTNSNL